ncbi:amino acid permease, partial [Streptomyces caeruleatus]
GVFLWVEKAFGKKIGFLAIWMQFIANVIWYPTVLSFAAGTIAWLINPALVQNKFYLISVILGIFWVTTILNLKGMRASGWISS